MSSESMMAWRNERWCSRKEVTWPPGTHLKGEGKWDGRSREVEARWREEEGCNGHAECQRTALNLGSPAALRHICTTRPR